MNTDFVIELKNLLIKYHPYAFHKKHNIDALAYYVDSCIANAHAFLLNKELSKHGFDDIIFDCNIKAKNKAKE